MSGDQAALSIFVVLALILPLSALLARRLPAGKIVRLALIWCAIIASLLLLVRALGVA
jgi:aspartyl protease family protein